MPAQRLPMAALLVAATLLAGCQSRPPAAPVDAARAEATLEKVLDGWKEGATPDHFRQSEPAIVVQDLDWQGGMVLVDYEVQKPGQPQDANLLCDVRLKLTDPQGAPLEKTVTYIIGTDPVLTVFRKLF